MTIKPLKNRNLVLAALAISLVFFFWWQSPLTSIAQIPTRSEPNWVLPMNPPIRLLGEYRQPNSDYGAGHRGVDVAAAEGEDVLAPADGVVSFAGSVVDRSVISIRHDEHFVSSAEPVCALAAPGERVFAGQLVGQVCSGKATYRGHCVELNCVHWSLRYDGKYLSLFGKLGFVSPSRLKPVRI